MNKAEKETKHLKGELYKANKGQQKLYQENKKLKKSNEKRQREINLLNDRLEELEKDRKELRTLLQDARPPITIFSDNHHIIQDWIDRKKQALKNQRR